MKTTREETIARLLEIRNGAWEDLATMPAAKEGTEWATDRRREILWVNRELARLGAIPAM